MSKARDTADLNNGIDVDASGNVGIGTSSPSSLLDVSSSASVTQAKVTNQSTGAAAILFQNSDTGTGNGDGLYLGRSAGINYLWTYENEPLVFATNNLERMRITSSGGIEIPNQNAINELTFTGTEFTNVLSASTSGFQLGTTGAGYLSFLSNNAQHMRIDSGGQKIMNGNSTWAGISGGTQSGCAFNDAGDLYSSRATNTSSVHVRWYNTNGQVGNIATNGSSTLYNTSSDYRLKENVVDLTDATDRLKLIPVHRFNFIADEDTTVDGFLAHEVQDIVPEAVTGTKDGMQDEEYEVTPAVEATYDDDGNELTAAVEAVMGTRSVPDYQGIDQSKLVPLLTAALQEALTEISSLKTRVEALEAE